MPVKIPNNLPARETLSGENIFVMTEERAVIQDIRPLKIAILNLMPNKETTETQLLRLIGNSPLQIEITLLYTATYKPKNTAAEYLKEFYRTFDDIKNEKFDGLIITGAPVEKVDYDRVDYWDELCRIMDWADSNVYSTLFICWAALAGLHYHYGIRKHTLEQKLSGVYPHRVLLPQNKLMRGFDDIFYAPHSRYSIILNEDIQKERELELLAESKEAGPYAVVSRDLRRLFVTGHSEYDALTLDAEYKRDLAAGLNPHPPVNYYPDNDAARQPVVRWRSHANLLFSNWLNYCVYQETPYELAAISKKEAGQKGPAK